MISRGVLVLLCPYRVIYCTFSTSAFGTRRTGYVFIGSTLSEVRNLAIIFTADKGITNVTDVLINWEQARGEGQ